MSRGWLAQCVRLTDPRPRACACREERQCWELAAACLDHCRLALEGFNPAAAAEAGPAKPPGFDVLADVLGGWGSGHRWSDSRGWESCC